MIPTAGCPPPIAGLREAELHHLWLEQRFPPGALTTATGERVRVLYRGRPGGGAGPDFRDARISIGGAAPRLGDVELHVTAADFRRHGHLDDPAYGRVVLHVVFDAQGETTTPLPGGGAAPVLALLPWVVRRSAEIAAWVATAVPWREPCHSAVARLGEPAVRALLHKGGERRLRDKAAAIGAELTGDRSEHVLYRALCGALGLSRNVEPFRALADRAPLSTLLHGLTDDDERAERAIRERLMLAAGFGDAAPALGGLPWLLDGLRPNAHPAKRIAGLAAILSRRRHAGLERALRDAAADGSTALLRVLQAPSIGRDRVVELAVNAVLPFLIANGDASRALELAAALPAAAEYGPLTLLRQSLVSVPASDTPARPLVTSSVLAQQGALALHKDWCRRGGCGVCPLS